MVSKLTLNIHLNVPRVIFESYTLSVIDKSMPLPQYVCKQLCLCLILPLYMFHLKNRKIECSIALKEKLPFLVCVQFPILHLYKLPKFRI